MNERLVIEDCEVALVKKVSSKTGREYEVLVIKFANGYEKQDFISDSEKYMLHGMID